MRHRLSIIMDRTLVRQGILADQHDLRFFEDP
jgi:hypothetical protein